MLIKTAAAAATVELGIGPVLAQQGYSTRPTKLTVPFPTGGSQ